MSYEVLHTFKENEHKGAVYQEGEIYPKAGFEAKPKRVEFLQSDNNKYKKAFLGPELKEKDYSSSTKDEGKQTPSDDGDAKEAVVLHSAEGDEKESTKGVAKRKKSTSKDKDASGKEAEQASSDK